MLVGSEGTLGVVTKIVLKLLPLPAFDMLMLVPFSNASNACAAVGAVFRAGIAPSAMEFMEKAVVDLVIHYNPNLDFPRNDNVQAFLFIEVDGNNTNILMQACEKIATVVAQFGAGEIALAQSDTEMERLWSLRRKAGEAVKMHSVYKEEDTVVPRT